jgi:hypothetical protein
MTRLCVARSGCNLPEVILGFCRKHAPTNEYDIRFYRLRYIRLYCKLRQNQITLAEYHNQRLASWDLKSK